MTNPIKILSAKEKLFWLVSVILVVASNFLSPETSLLSIVTSIVGVTGVLYIAKGYVFGQFVAVVFCILYAIVSFTFHYWGEMITYIFMSLPMSIWAIYTWIKNPSSENENEVKINHLTKKNIIYLIVSSIIVTTIFYFILKFFNTPNLVFSTISITTSYVAAALVMLRSSYYAIWYIFNDIVLIILWTLASIKDPSYIPVIVNFMVMLVDDAYGFICWRKREKKMSDS